MDPEVLIGGHERRGSASPAIHERVVEEMGLRVPRGEYEGEVGGSAHHEGALVEPRAVVPDLLDVHLRTVFVETTAREPGEEL